MTFGFYTHFATSLKLFVFDYLNILVRTVANFFHWSMFFLWALVKWSQTFL